MPWAGLKRRHPGAGGQPPEFRDFVLEVLTGLFQVRKPVLDLLVRQPQNLQLPGLVGKLQMELGETGHGLLAFIFVADHVYTPFKFIGRIAERSTKIAKRVPR